MYAYDDIAFDIAQAVQLYQTMRPDELLLLRAAFELDRQHATEDRARQFASTRIGIINGLLDGHPAQADNDRDRMT